MDFLRHSRFDYLNHNNSGYLYVKKKRLPTFEEKVSEPDDHQCGWEFLGNFQYNMLFDFFRELQGAAE
jgi:hypothetical protein